MNKGTAIIGMLLTFVGGWFMGSLMSGPKGDPTVTASTASLEAQERLLGPGNPQSDRSRVLVAPDDPFFGPADAPVTIIEFSDFECPFCSRAMASVNEIKKTYGNKVRFVFKQNPLPFHKKARAAATASLAAHEQGKFWEYHDKLFANQKSIDRASLDKYASELGLDMGKFKAAMDGDKFKSQIDRDIAYAAKVGARGTPTFFINGKLLRGAQPFARFKPVIDAEITFAENMIGQKKVAASAVYNEIMKGAKVGAAAPSAPKQRPGTPDPARTYKVPVGSSPVMGNDNALLTIIEFSDFQCPFCTRVLPTLKSVKEKYGKDVRVVFKHQPLPMHPDAPLAAEASLAAAEQGKFEAYHDKLFANQKALKRPQLDSYAKALGLNMSKFKAALDSGKFKKQVQADQALARQFGVRGTPSFFINGRPLRGAQPLPNFIKVADEELAKAKKLAASGMPRNKIYTATIAKGLTKVTAAPARPQPGRPDPNTVYRIPVAKSDPSKGPANAKVTIVEFSDFQCPFCSRVGPTLSAITKKYPKDVRVIFKNLPLPMHPNAPLAAEAGLAAHAQGKFWQMHDQMFANQKKLDRASINGYAAKIGLNVARFKKDLDSGKYKAAVKRDMAIAAKFAVRGTPSFFVNGKPLPGGVSIPALDAKVQEGIKAADALIKKGAQRGAIYAALTKAGKTSVQSGPAARPVDTKVYDVNPGRSPSFGSARAAVTIIEFSDFQCPFCSRVLPTLAQIKKAYPTQVRVVFKHLPLPMHPQAPLAAEASLAAHAQGKFWQYHDKLFQNQRKLDRASLDGYAQELGLNMGKFKAALDSGKFKAAVKADQKAAASAGITGTPAFLINGRKLSGAVPFPQFKAMIDAELKRGKRPSVLKQLKPGFKPGLRPGLNRIKRLKKAPGKAPSKLAPTPNPTR